MKCYRMCAQVYHIYQSISTLHPYWKENLPPSWPKKVGVRTRHADPTRYQNLPNSLRAPCSHCHCFAVKCFDSKKKKRKKLWGFSFKMKSRRGKASCCTLQLIIPPCLRCLCVTHLLSVRLSLPHDISVFSLRHITLPTEERISLPLPSLCLTASLL